MRDTLAMILAGGVGSRLNVLVSHRAKPAVPFGGLYRIIDFALSNAMNSGLTQLAVLTQYKPLSLMRHIGNGSAWDFGGRSREVKILPPRTGEKDSDWYKGTADAVRQNMDFLESRPSKEVLILSGDHVYYMDYRDMVRHHRASGARVTVAMMTVAWEETNQFGIGITDDTGRIVDWEEKPEKARSNLASMGIYVFDTEYLLKSLRSTKDVDFGHHILPQAMRAGYLYAYIFNSYWRDVGTVNAYWDANMDLLRPERRLDTQLWGVVTNVENEGIFHDRSPARLLPGARVRDSSLAAGCIIRGTVEGSVLSPGVIVEAEAEVRHSVVMHDTVVQKGAVLHRVVCDKQVTVGRSARIGIGDPEVSNRRYPKHLHDGITLIGKRAVIPQGAAVGTNCIVFPDLRDADWPAGGVLPDGETAGESSF